jgi:microcystin-dependent protein
LGPLLKLFIFIIKKLQFMKKLLLSVLLVIGLGLSSSAQYSAVEAYIGEIRLFAGNYAPAGWAFCNGQPMAISQYQALFAVIGINYGGNGVQTFNLPDLRGRVPVHSGAQQAPDVPFVQLGQRLGSASYTPIASPKFQKNDSTGVSIPQLIGNPNPVPHSLYQPSLGLNYIICLSGLWPNRE